MTISKYTVVDKNDDDLFPGGWMTESYDEAKRVAQERQAIVKCYEFEFSDSFLLDDYTTGNDETEA